MRLTSGTIVALAFVLASPIAHADVAPPDVTACGGKKAGDACDQVVNGKCHDETCQRIDYMNDGGTVSYPCLKCKAVDAGSEAGAPTSDAGNGGESLSGGSGGGGCNVGAVPRAALPWLLALAVPALVFGLRRKKT